MAEFCKDCAPKFGMKPDKAPLLCENCGNIIETKLTLIQIIMKKIFTLLLITLFVSCSKSKEEQMLYDYIEKEMKESINVNIEDTDFKIKSINPDGVIKSIDSLNYYKNNLATLWLGRDASQNEKDTLSYKYVLKEVGNTINTYNELIMSYLKADMEYKTYDLKRKRDDSRKYQKDLIWWSLMDRRYSKNKDSVLSYKYKATYALTNPILKVKQTFDNTYYTNAMGTEIVKKD